MTDTLRSLLDVEWRRAVQPQCVYIKDRSAGVPGHDNVRWRFRYDGHVVQDHDKLSHREISQLWQLLIKAMDVYPNVAWEQQLNNVISETFILELSPNLESEKEAVILKTLSLLQRIGRQPHHMVSTNAFGQEDPILDASHPRNNNTLALRIALAVAVSRSGRFTAVSRLQDLTNILSELIDVGLDDSFSIFDDADECARDFVFHIYSQILKLYQWYIVAHHLAAGYDKGWEKFLVLTQNVEIKRRSKLYGKKSNTEIPRYMCNWAFRLLRHSRASFAMDFRQLFLRFRDLHEHKMARCLSNDPWNPCTGLHPLSCGRFQDKLLVLPEQSVHTEVCNRRKCYRMKWKLKSYDALDGCARAVRLSAADETKTRVTYTGGSDRTMAISHVWSHGHGGRPATGMNRCLHDRFSAIALRAGCDSYWIDTLSIPEDHTRRREAIHHINDTFFRARIVLIVDRDIMSINITDEHGQDGTVTPYTPSTIPIPLLESLLATFLVCDWNVRAWTMLEAVKGCRNLHLLCQDGHTLPLQACLCRLCDEGSLNMTTMLLSAQHLLPVANSHEPPSHGLDTAGVALMYRHATRPGDDLVIWCLMTNELPQTNATEFWKSMVGRQIRTGFLVSTIKRLRGVRGFSWAPETPYMRWWEGAAQRLPHEQKWDPRILPSEGSGSRLARITERGLRGAWQFYRVRPEEDYTRAYGSPRNAEMGNACLRVAACLTSWAPHVALLDVAAEDGAELYQGQPGGDGWTTQALGFVVVWSGDGEVWHWYGVLAWRLNEERLTMEVKEILIE